MKSELEAYFKVRASSPSLPSHDPNGGVGGEEVSSGETRETKSN